MAAIPFVAPLEGVKYGDVEQLSPRVQRVIAENPSKYTYRGTGTYIVGHDRVAVIDPGPLLDSHRDALRRALSGRIVDAILITHTHGDHSPLAAWLQAETGAATFGYGPHGDIAEPDDDDDDDETDRAPAATPDPASEAHPETIDREFTPTIAVRDGHVVAGPGWTFRAVFTPGHTSNHVCYALREEATLFSGDHVMGWSTAVISPPDGDMGEYCRSLERLIRRAHLDRIYRPTHGGPITDPAPFVRAYLDHRLERERAVVELIGAGVASIRDIVEILYVDVRQELHRAAGRSIFAHITKLVADGAVTTIDGAPLRLRAKFCLV